MNASSFSAFSSMSPKLTTSTATLDLRSFFPTAGAYTIHFSAQRKQLLWDTHLHFSICSEHLS
jgi:hypothetical protein